MFLLHLSLLLLPQRVLLLRPIFIKKTPDDLQTNQVNKADPSLVV